ADLDPADDAVCAWRSRHLDAVALRTVTLDDAGQIDCIRIRGNPDRLDRAGRLAQRRQRSEEDDDTDEAAPRARGALRRPAGEALFAVGAQAILEGQFSQD